jgi:hypothetical protein
MPCTYLGHQQYFSNWTYGFSSLTHRHENWDCKRWKYINKKPLVPIIPYKQSREIIKLWTSCAKILAQSHFITPIQHQPYIILHPKHIVPCAKGNALPTTQGCDLKAWVFGQNSVKWKFCIFLQTSLGEFLSCLSAPTTWYILCKGKLGVRPDGKLKIKGPTVRQ